MISSLVASVVFLQVQEPVKDYKLPIMSIGEFGEWLGKETGEIVIVLPGAADREVYINVKQRTLREVEEFVAEAVEVKIIRKNGAVTIVPGQDKGDDRDFSGLGNLEAYAVPRSEVDGLPQYYSHLKEKVAEFLDNSSSSDLFSEMDQRDPMRIAFRNVASAIGERGFRSMPENETVVFSTHPTPMQRPWPVDATRELDLLNRLCTAKNKGLAGSRYHEMAPETIGPHYNHIYEIYGGESSPVGAMTFSVRVDGAWINCSLTMFDKKGNTENVHHEDFTLDTYEIEGDEGWKKRDRQIVLSDKRYAELLEVEAMIGQGEAPDPRPFELIRLAKVDQTSALSGAASRLFDEACQRMGRELVTEVVGIPEIWYGSEFGHAVNSSDLFEGKRGKGSNSPVILPSYYDRLERKKRYDQRGVAERARSAISKGFLSLDDLATIYRNGTRGESFRRSASSLIYWSGQGSNSSSLYENSAELLLLTAFCGLDDSTRRRLASGYPVDIDLSAGDTPLRRELLSYCNFGYMQLEIPGLSEEARGESDPTDWEQEPSVLLCSPKFSPIRLRVSYSEVKSVEAKIAWEDQFYFRTIPFEQLEEFLKSGDEQTGGVVDSYAVVTEAAIEGTFTFGRFQGSSSRFSLLSRPPKEFIKVDRKTFERTK